MNSLTQYNRVRSLLRPGDLVMFWGRAPLSRIIEAVDAGPSHSAVVRQGVHPDFDATICQSTIQKWNGVEVNGVQTDPLGATIAGYDSGADIAALRLDDPIRAKIDWEQFYKVIGAAEDRVKYDIPDLIEFLIRDIPVLGARVGQGEHKARMVCSSWVTAVLESCGVLTGINWTQVTPQQLVEMHIYRDFLPLLGNPKPSRFNTI
jgi:hypothetical protein